MGVKLSYSVLGIRKTLELLKGLGVFAVILNMISTLNSPCIS
jgi:hypothetical protein